MGQLSFVVYSDCLIFEVFMYTLDMLLDILLRIVLLSADMTSELLLLSLKNNCRMLIASIQRKIEGYILKLYILVHYFHNH